MRHSFPFSRHYMSDTFLCHLSCVWSIHCRCTTNFLILLHTRLYHIFLFEILSFSISLDLMVFSPFEMFAEICSCIQILHDQICYRLNIPFIFKRRKVIIGTSLDPCYIPLISCFSSHDGFVSNALSSFVPKIVTWKTLPIKKVPATINLVIVISIDIHIWRKFSMICLRLVVAFIHPWSRLSMIYVVISFIPLLMIVILFTGLCYIKIAFGGGWRILWLRCFFSISKTYLYQWRTLKFDNFI